MENFKIKLGIENMDINAIQKFLNEESYWAKGIPREIVSISLQNSFCAGTFLDRQQIAFARLITDYATFAYLADVYVLPEFRGKGLSKLLVSEILTQPFVLKLRRILLATADAHSLYQKFGFAPPADPGTLMEIKRNNIYDK